MLQTLNAVAEQVFWPKILWRLSMKHFFFLQVSLKVSSQNELCISVHTQLLKLHPYQINVINHIHDVHKKKQLYYCQWFRSYNQNDMSFLDKVFLTNEAWFQPRVYTNNHNNRMVFRQPNAFQSSHTIFWKSWCDVPH